MKGHLTTMLRQFAKVTTLPLTGGVRRGSSSFIIRHSSFVIFLFSLFIFLSAPLSAQCPLPNTAFGPGESLDYQLYFNWKFIWLKAGTANLRIDAGRYNGQDILRARLLTRGNKRTDRFFMMRDTITSYITHDLVPLYYRKGALEGKRHNIDEVWYTYPEGRTHLRQRYVDYKDVEYKKELDADECYYDMLSMLLRARSFDAKDMHEGQRFRFKMAHGSRESDEVFVYRGKKEIKMEQTRTTYRCLVFSFVEYNKEKKREQEVITFYITDDDNHIPVRLDMFLRFGTAKAFLSSATPPRHPQTSIVSKK